MKKKSNSKRKKRNKSTVGVKHRNCNEMSFEKNAGIITDNEYEIASEMSCNCNRKNNKKRCH